MERPPASERRKKEAAAGCRFDATRVDPEDVINDLLQNTDLNTDHTEGEKTAAGARWDREGRERKDGRGVREEVGEGRGGRGDSDGAMKGEREGRAHRRLGGVGGS